MRRDQDHDIDMIWGNMALQDIDVHLLTFLPDNGTHPFYHLIMQYLVAILGDPDDMEVDRKRLMGAMAIVTHVLWSTQYLLKLPPAGGDLDY
jgi:hypothetical protein